MIGAQSEAEPDQQDAEGRRIVGRHCAQHVEELRFPRRQQPPQFAQVPAFRVIQAVLFLSGLADAPNYIVSLWLSIAASVWLAESCLGRSRRSSIELFAPPSPQAGVVS